MQYKIISQKFEELFGNSPHLVRSPGRINLIGEHTDYNNGLVLPAAIDKNVVFAVGLNETNKIRIYAFDLKELFETEITHIVPSPKRWPNYVLGVVDQLIKKGYEIPGFDCVFGSDIPIGAGLSSSAAIECGMAYSLNIMLGLGIEKLDLVRVSLAAEQDFAGLNCGIMDQFANIYGKENHVIQLDCRSLEYKYFPFILKDLEIVLCDTQVKHSLASSEYNTRRKECEEGVKILKKHDQKIESLRDVKPDFVKYYKNELPDKVYQRCLYVSEEISRIEMACIDLVNSDMNSFGAKMYETHSGLSQLYEVSCHELDYLVEIARESGVVKGARMMGGGFGGCTINLVEKTGIEKFTGQVGSEYLRQFQKEPGIYHVAIKDGTSSIEE